MRIKVSYPSGNVLHLSGEWKGPGHIKGLGIILIKIDQDSPVPEGMKSVKEGALIYCFKCGTEFIGDIRGVYQNEDTGEILYNPRNALEGMNQWAVDWLNLHREWPAILEL